MALIRRTPLQRSTRRIRPVSVKRARINKIYSALRLTYLRDHPYDQLVMAQLGLNEDEVIKNRGRVFLPDHTFVNVPAADQIHHKRGRGKYLLDITTWMSVSFGSHRWLHDNTGEAYEKGWMLPRN